MTEPRKIRVFLCHASQDKPVVRELYQRLASEGWIDPWLDEEKLLPGQDWDMEIEKAVETSDAVIVFLSNNSVSKEGYIQRELRFVLHIALEKPEGAIFIIPLRLDDCQIPRHLRTWQYVDYFPEDHKEWAYQRLLESLNLRLKDAIDVHIRTDQAKTSKSVWNPFNVEIGKLAWWAGHLRHDVGRRLSEKEWEAAPSDAQGYLVYGPYIDLDSGCQQR
jgi:hypothetical protein